MFSSNIGVLGYCCFLNKCPYEVDVLSQMINRLCERNRKSSSEILNRKEFSCMLEAGLIFFALYCHKISYRILYTAHPIPPISHGITLYFTRVKDILLAMIVYEDLSDIRNKEKHIAQIVLGIVSNERVLTTFSLKVIETKNP